MPDDVEGVDPARLESAQIQILDGSTFMLSDPRGDVQEGSVAGLYHEDTRYLSSFRFTVNGATPVVLTSDKVDYYSAAFYMTNPELDGIPAKSFSIQRYRFVGDGMRESILIRSHLNEPLELEVRLSCKVDFADLFEVRHKQVRKGGKGWTEHDAEHCLLSFRYEHSVFKAASRIHSSENGRIDGDDMVFDVKLEARGDWDTTIEVAVHLHDVVLEPVRQQFADDEREAGVVLQKWRDDVPRLAADWDVFEHVYQRSIVDLAALRLFAQVEGNEFALPAAGLPWFMAIFGRDTLITSYQSLLIGPELAKGALHSLASLQGTEVNDYKDEEPGKILHEIRFGELTAIGLRPHRPYYGTADATQLFLILLSEYWRFTKDDQTVSDMRENVMRALEWIDHYGDLDGDGYVEYKTRSSQGLVNQSWKDSWNSMMFRDGTIAEPPIAGCELQGYVYDAKVRTAELAEKVWRDAELAKRLRDEASKLYDRFNEDYWVEDRGGYYAIALDADKQRVDCMSSNMGHLLWSGIVPKDRAKVLRDQLFSGQMWSGWGVRTMSADDAGYNPVAYHDGTIWPHDNSIISAGLYRYGFREEAGKIADDLTQAAAYTDYRLPEVFAGYVRSFSRFPVRYPTACSPQAWATAAPFLWLRIILGIEADDGKIVADPAVPMRFGKLFFHGLHAFGTHYDVTGDGNVGKVELTS